MTDREHTPGSAQRGAGTQGRREVDPRCRQRTGATAETVWQALTDRRSCANGRPSTPMGAWDVGTKVKLTTVGAPTPHVTETTVTRADAPKVLEYTGVGRYAVATRSRWGRHAPDAVDQHRIAATSRWVPRVAHLLRCAGPPAWAEPPRPHVGLDAMKFGDWQRLRAGTRSNSAFKTRSDENMKSRTRVKASRSALISKRIAELGLARGDAQPHAQAHQTSGPGRRRGVEVGQPVWSHDGIICTGESYKAVVSLLSPRAPL